MFLSRRRFDVINMPRPLGSDNHRRGYPSATNKAIKHLSAVYRQAIAFVKQTNNAVEGAEQENDLGVTVKFELMHGYKYLRKSGANLKLIERKCDSI